MLTIKGWLLLALVGFAVGFIIYWVAAIKRARRDSGTAPSLEHTAIGFVTNFFDTLGIGSFATTTAWFKLRRLVPDQVIPGTLNTGHTLPTVAQALIYIAAVNVDTLTLVLMIIGAVLGSYFGASLVAGWSRRAIQIGMGAALLCAATLMLSSQLGITASGGEAIGLRGVPLVIGVFGNFVLGALMTLGIGLYGPCMILISLLGMNPLTAFPIMMGSCAFLMPVGSAQFIRKDSYHLRAALGLAIGGIPAVLIAAYIVRQLPLSYVRWLVVVVVVYTAVMMLRSAATEVRATSPATAGD
jgi:uncharacterized membrane protein YfcA